MQPHPPPSRTRNPPWLRLLIWGLISLPVLFLLIVGWRWQLKRDVDRQLAELQAQGVPLNGADLNDFYPAVPEDQNAGLVMTQAFVLMQEYPDERSAAVRNWQAPRRENVMDPDDVELLEGHVSLNAAAIAKARDACELPLCRYPVDFSPGIDTLLPHLASLKNLARCEYFNALLNIQKGDLTEANDNVQTMLALGRTLESEPSFLSQLVNMAVVAMTTDAAEHLINAGPLDRTELQDLAIAFDDAARTNRMVLGLSGEMAFLTPLFRMSWTEIQYFVDGGGAEDNRPPPGRSPLGLRLTGIFDRDLRHFLASMQTNLRFAALPPPESLGVLELEAENIETAWKRYYVLSAMFLSPHSKGSTKDAETTARIRLVTTALAVEQLRLGSLDPPPNLLGMAPQHFDPVPIDPFDGQPLRYRKLDRGYMLYSVGRNRQDDGGRERPPRVRSTDTNSYDLTFTVER